MMQPAPRAWLIASSSLRGRAAPGAAAGAGLGLAIVVPAVVPMTDAPPERGG